MIPRYTRPEMGSIWDDQNRYEAWLAVEVLAAEAMSKKGLVPKKAINVIKKKAKVNVKRILKIEERTKHDIIAFLTQIEEAVGPEARFLHMGLTSSDVVDTSMALMITQASAIIKSDLQAFKKTLKALARKHKNHPMVGRSHGIHAEPITFGVKVAGWLSETDRNIERFNRAAENAAYGKLSGAVGTFAHNDPYIERYVCQKLKLKPEPLATQVVPRDRHAEYLTALAMIGGMLERIAVEIRHLQRTEVLEVEEPFSKGQKGSSAMPHKRNPIGSENITGLARLLRGNSMAALENIALWHERDISHSSVERVVFPDSTILVNYALNRMNKILKGLQVYPKRMKRNLQKTQDFLATQKILLSLVDKGLDRQKAYEMVQKNALDAWINEKSFRGMIEDDERITDYLSQKELDKCFDTTSHLRHVKTLFKRVKV